MSKSKAKGTSAETAIVNYLNSLGDKHIRAVRMPLHGTKDEGDIDIYPIPIAIEVKNHATSKLAEWVDEVEEEKINKSAIWGVVWHKRARKSSPSQWYVTMTGETFANMLQYLNYPH